VELSQEQFKGHVCSQESGVGDLPGNKASSSCTLLLIKTVPCRNMVAVIILKIS